MYSYYRSPPYARLQENIHDFSPKELKIHEDDIIITVTDPPINIELFYQFLNNVEKGIDDSIRIIQYTFEAIPLVKYLFFDGDKIILIDDTRYSTYEYDIKEINKYEGNTIFKRVKNGIISYHLLSSDGDKQIFQILDFLIGSSGI